MQRRIHHSTVALTADDRFQFDHLPCDIGFTYRGAYHTGARCLRGIIDHQARREITHDGSTRRRADGPDRKRERVILADRPSLFVDDREPIDIRIHGDADVGFPPAHERAEVSQFLRHRLGRPRKQPIGLEVDRRNATAQPFEELGHHRSAGTTHGIERDTKPPATDLPEVHRPQREHGGEVAGNRVRIRLDTADRLVARSWEGLPRRQFAYPGPRYPIKKDAIGPDEFESIPFDRIVASRDDDAAGGPVVLHRQLYRGSCN